MRIRIPDCWINRYYLSISWMDRFSDHDLNIRLVYIYSHLMMNNVKIQYKECIKAPICCPNDSTWSLRYYTMEISKRWQKNILAKRQKQLHVLLSAFTYFYDVISQWLGRIIGQHFILKGSRLTGEMINRTIQITDHPAKGLLSTIWIQD